MATERPILKAIFQALGKLMLQFLEQYLTTMMIASAAKNEGDGKTENGPTIAA